METVKPRWSTRKRAGFTLVELLIVVVIISVLALIAIPQLMKTTKSSGKAAAESNHRIILGAIHAYMSDNDSSLPDGFNFSHINGYVNMDSPKLVLTDDVGFVGEDGTVYPLGTTYGWDDSTKTLTTTFDMGGEILEWKYSFNFKTP